MVEMFGGRSRGGRARRLRAGLPAVLALAAVCAAGCSGDGDGGEKDPDGAGTPAAAAPCANPDLSLRLGEGQGGAGTHVRRVEIVNNGAPCTLAGRPEIYPYTGDGQRIAGIRTGEVPEGFGGIGGVPAGTTLAERGSAVFYLVSSSGGEECAEATGLAFNAPGTADGVAPVLLDWDWTPCGDVGVSAVFPPTSNF